MVLHSEFCASFQSPMRQPSHLLSSLLASCSTVLIYGQVYTFYSMKTAYIVSFFVFVVGSAVAASATSSTVFIVGRALSGLGSAGVFAGSSM